MNIYSLDKILYRLLATVTYAKGDRVIINYGTARSPEYYPATVTLLRAGMMYVLFDDGTKEKYKPVAGKTGLMGRAKTSRKRTTLIPQEKLDLWLLSNLKPKKALTVEPKQTEGVPMPQLAPITTPPQIKPLPVIKPVGLVLDYKQAVYLQDSAENVWKIIKEKIKHLDADIYQISKQGHADNGFHSVSTAPSLKEAIAKIKQILAARRVTILQHRVIND